jgi:gamma-glutamylcyclotransferase (GGCT)/AIG2-like uncharacterized protein YtfP
VPRLFVYGSLRRGERNHDFLAGASYLGRVRTRPLYTLRRSGITPGLGENGHQAVAGELYELTDDHLRRLDRLGGAPGLYLRKTVQLSDGSDVDAYVMPEAHARCYPEVASGDWARPGEA